MKAVVILLILVVCGGVFVVSCPNAAEHKAAISQSLNGYVASSMIDDADVDEMPFALLGSAFATNIVSAMLDKMLTVDNYYVCSVGKIHFDGEERIVSFGALGHVYTFTRKDLERAAEDGGDVVPSFLE